MFRFSVKFFSIYSHLVHRSIKTVETILNPNALKMCFHHLLITFLNFLIRFIIKYNNKARTSGASVFLSTCQIHKLFHVNFINLTKTHFSIFLIQIR